MVWIITGVCLLLVSIAIVALAKDNIEHLAVFFPSLIVIVSCLVIAIVCPCNWYATRGDAWSAEEYYESVVAPNIIEEGDDYVVVQSLIAGVWQSGESNLYWYNSYLRNTRHWQEIPVIGWCIYPVPEHLKSVRIQGGN